MSETTLASCLNLPERSERSLEQVPSELPEQREIPWRTIWPSEVRVPGLPVLEFHEEPLPPYLYGPYRQDVAK
jgi:hypothetical protein